MRVSNDGLLMRLLPQGALGIAFLSYALFSISDVSVKAIGPTLSPFEVSFFVAVFSAVVLPFIKQPDETWRGVFAMRRPALTLFRSVSGTLAGIFSILAFTHVSFAEAYAVIFFAPIMALVLSVVFLAEKVGWRRWTSVAIGIVGVLIVTRPGFRDVQAGHMAALASAFFIAASIVCLRVLGKSERPITIFAMLTVINLAIVLPLMLVTGFAPPTLAQWGLLGLCGLTGGLGQLLLMAATRRAPANQIAPLQYSQLGWAIVYGGLFFAELPDLATIVGLVCIVASGLFLIQRRPKDAVVVPGTH